MREVKVKGEDLSGVGWAGFAEGIFLVGSTFSAICSTNIGRTSAWSPLAVTPLFGIDKARGRMLAKVNHSILRVVAHTGLSFPVH